jgi:hypothetical protein
MLRTWAIIIPPTTTSAGAMQTPSSTTSPNACAYDIAGAS